MGSSPNSKILAIILIVAITVGLVSAVGYYVYYPDTDGHAITFETEGGDAVTGDKLNHDVTIDWTSYTTSKEGYTFVAWKLVDGDTLVDIPEKMPANDITVKATWAKNYTITFDSNGGSDVDPIPQGEGLPITALDKPTKDGHTFVAWKIVEGETPAELPEKMPANDITVKATWKINVTVTPDDRSKVFGDEDPALTYTLSKDIAVTGNLARVTGADVGTYRITMGSLVSDDEDYKLIMVTPSAEFKITAKDISSATVTVDPEADLTYNGSEVRPGVTVRSKGDTFTYHTVSYENNTDAGIAKAIVTGTGNYTGSTEVRFTIARANLAEANVTASPDTTYNGNAQVPTVTVKINGTPLDADTGYKVHGLNAGFIDAKTYKITVNAVYGGNYTGSANVEYTIAPANLTSNNVTLEGTVYDGNIKTPQVKVRGVTLTAYTDYTWSFADGTSAATNAGTYTVTVTGKGNYSGEVTKNFRITAKQFDFTVDQTDDEIYTGSEIIKTFTFIDTDNRHYHLVLDKDYKVSYTRDNVNVGTVEVTVSGIGNYSGTATTTFKITKYDITDKANIGAIGAQEYTGSAIKPGITVTLAGFTEFALTNDYSVSYTTNINAGPATVKVTGKGNFTGSAEATFTILAKDLSSAVVTLDPKVDSPYAGDDITLRVKSVKLDRRTLAASNYDVYFTDPEGKTIDTATNAGTYKVTITGKGNYSGIVTENFTITAKEYTITFSEGITVNDGMNNIITGTKVAYGTELTVTAEKEGHTYALSASSGTIDDNGKYTVEGAVRFSAEYKLIEYIINWIVDGTTLRTEQVAYGETPEYNGETPTKVATDEFTYTFDKWTPEVVTVTDAADYTAVFTETSNNYIISWNNHDGTEFESEALAYGTTITAPSTDPTKESTDEFEYTFSGWDGLTDGMKVTGEVTFTAKFTEETRFYAVNFYDTKITINDTENNQITNGLKVAYDTVLTVTAEDKTGHTSALTANVGDISVDGIYTVTEAVIFSVVYTPIHYTVTFGEGITVNVGDSPITSGNTVAYDTVLTVSTEEMGKSVVLIGKEETLILSGDGPHTVTVQEPMDFIICTASGSTTGGDLGAKENPYVINRDYKDANPTEGMRFTDNVDYTIEYRDEGGEIDLSMPDGGTTFIGRILLTSTSDAEDKFDCWVIFKYGSVTIGDNEDYMTIEDALSNAGTNDTIIVKQNTSFASEDVANSVYRYEGHEGYNVKKGVTLLLPYDNEYSEEYYDNTGDNNKSEISLDRDGAYVKLTMPESISLDVLGTLTVNAKRNGTSQPYQNYICGDNYSKLEMYKNSIINVNGGKLNVIGFIHGEGKISAFNSATVRDTVFMSGWRGGEDSLSIAMGNSDIFPFEQFSMINIETDLEINSGATYKSHIFAYASKSYTGTDIGIIGGEECMLYLKDEASVLRKFDTATGNVTFELNGGEATLKDIEITVGFTVSSENKNLPLDGRWHFVIKDGCKLDVDAQVSLLPGSSLIIEEGATVNVNGGLTIFNPYEYLYGGNSINKYPADNTSDYYRISPNFEYNNTTPAKLVNNGTLNVYGKIAGRVTGTEPVLHNEGEDDFKIHYILAKSETGVRSVQLWTDEKYAISVTTYKNEDDITVKALVKDVDGEPVSDKVVTFTIDGGTIGTATTDSKGYASPEASLEIDWDSKFTITVEVDDISANGILGGVAPSECVAEGTLITLADGTQVPVEELTGDELLLVWNLYTGTFDVAPMIFIDSDPYAEYEIIHLYFSDGTEVKVIYEHGFWDVDLNRYVYINDNDPQQYIGHRFNKQTIDDEGNLQWTEVQLVDVRIYNEYTTAWSPVTAEHLCFYVNGMLSMPGNVSGMFNIFEVCPDTLQIDQESYLADIEEYGLYTYEEFSEMLYVPEEIFDIFQAKYFKIAIGKGLMDMDRLVALLEQYSDLLGVGP